MRLKNFDFLLRLIPIFRYRQPILINSSRQDKEMCENEITLYRILQVTNDGFKKLQEVYISMSYKYIISLCTETL